MNKITQLFIRACKSKNPQKRLRSISRRFYIRTINEDGYITMKLAEICDKYVPIKATKLYEELIHPFVMRDYSNQEKLFHFFLNNIRFAEISAFPGLTPPAMFKKN